MQNDVLTSSTTSEAANGWLGDTLNVVAQDFTMTLRAGLYPAVISNVLPTPLVV
jgi:hypothetical protein